MMDGPHITSKDGLELNPSQTFSFVSSPPLYASQAFQSLSGKKCDLSDTFIYSYYSYMCTKGFVKLHGSHKLFSLYTAMRAEIIQDGLIH